MDNIRLKSIQLLKEIDTICCDNKIEYSIGPKSMLALGNDITTIDYDVMMTVGNLLKFIEVAEKMKIENRSLEYMGNSKNFLGFHVHYVDENSTCINLKRGWDYRHYGIKIVIKPIRYKSGGLKEKVCGVLETGWNANGYRLTKKITPKRIFSVVVARLMMIFGRQRLARFIFNMIASTAKKETEECYFKNKAKQRKYCNKEYFKNYIRKQYGNDTFSVIEKYEEFLTDSYGMFWEDKAEGLLTYTGHVVIPLMPYKEYLKKLDDSGVQLDKFLKKQREDMVRGVWVKPEFKRRSQAIDIAKRSGDRLKYLEEFEPIKEEILKLYKDEDFERLSEIFDEHRSTTLMYLKKGLGFCVNEEYLKIQCDLFRYEGKDKTAEKLLQLVPREHHKAIK